MSGDKKAPQDQGQDVLRPSAPGGRWHARREALRLYLAVAAGSTLGGTARWLAGEAFQVFTSGAFPWSTLFVNITGSLLIGLYAALTGPEGRLLAGATQRHFVMTGLCGGYTTFSVFSLETVRLLEMGSIAAAGLNVGLSLAGWLVAVWAGYALGTLWSRLPR